MAPRVVREGVSNCSLETETENQAASVLAQSELARRSTGNLQQGETAGGAHEE